jgi:hypothetical protein
MYSKKQKRTAELMAFIATQAGNVERQKKELEKQRVKRLSL